MLAFKPLNWPKGNLCFGLTVAHEPESLGIVGLERPSQSGWTSLPCAGGRWQVQGSEGNSWEKRVAPGLFTFLCWYLALPGEWQAGKPV